MYFMSEVQQMTARAYDQIQAYHTITQMGTDVLAVWRNPEPATSAGHVIYNSFFGLLYNLSSLFSKM